MCFKLVCTQLFFSTLGAGATVGNRIVFVAGFHLSGVVTSPRASSPPAPPYNPEPEKKYKVSVSFDRSVFPPFCGQFGLRPILLQTEQSTNRLLFTFRF